MSIRNRFIVAAAIVGMALFSIAVAEAATFVKHTSYSTSPTGYNNQSVASVGVGSGYRTWNFELSQDGGVTWQLLDSTSSYFPPRFTHLNSGTSMFIPQGAPEAFAHPNDVYRTYQVGQEALTTCVFNPPDGPSGAPKTILTYC